jgi:APA family basic amino acid/polyamine antiporter
LRKKHVQPAGKEIYRMKLYPLLPIIFIASYAFVAVSIFLNSPATALTALGVMGFFMAIYFLNIKAKA